MCLGIVVFMLLGIHWGSWMWTFIIFINFGKLSIIISSKSFVSCLFLKFSHRSLHFVCMFFVGEQEWKDLFFFSFILDSFYCYAFKFTNIFFCNVYSPIIPPTAFFISDILVFISVSLIWVFLYIYSVFLLNVFNIRNTVATVLMSLPANSNICDSCRLVPTDCFPHYNSCFIPSLHAWKSLSARYNES